jgi:hypothetical protein
MSTGFREFNPPIDAGDGLCIVRYGWNDSESSGSFEYRVTRDELSKLRGHSDISSTLPGYLPAVERTVQQLAMMIARRHFGG